MGKQTKNPAKLQKKKEFKDTLSEQYDKFNNIQFDSSDDDETHPKGVGISGVHPKIITPPKKHPAQNSNKQNIPIISSDENLEYMVQNQIEQYMTNSQGMHMGVGKPLTQEEYNQLQHQ